MPVHEEDDNVDEISMKQIAFWVLVELPGGPDILPAVIGDGARYLDFWTGVGVDGAITEPGVNAAECLLDYRRWQAETARKNENNH
jgi:hypothetical protein